MTSLVFFGASVASLFVNAFMAMLFEGALASSTNYAIPTLSYQSSLWLTLLFGILVGGPIATSKLREST